MMEKIPLTIGTEILPLKCGFKGRCNYGVDFWYNQKSSHPKFHIHFFIDNFNVNISLHTLSCPKLKFGQLKAYKRMFTLKLSMKK